MDRLLGYFWRGLAAVFAVSALGQVAGAASNWADGRWLLISAVVSAALAWALWRLGSRRLGRGPAVAVSTDDMAAEVLELFGEVNAARVFPAAPAQRLMSTPDRPLLAVADATLLELRTVRSSTHVGTRVMLGGVPIYLGKSVPATREELREAATGELGLTADRLVFSGPTRATDFALSRLMSVDMLADGVVLTVTGRARPVLLRVRNPLLWAQLLRNVAALRMTGAELPAGAALQIR